MRIQILLVLSVFALSACVSDTSQPVQTSPTKPVVTKSNSRAVADYRRVIRRVEPVAESTCRSLHKNKGGKFCDFQIKLIEDPKQPANAFQTIGKDGRPIIAFNINLLKTVQSDDEIAFILGHEAGHQIATHIAKTQNNQAVGAILGGILIAAAGGDPQLGVDLGAMVGQRAYSQNYELEADTIGTHIAFRAGYSPERGAQYFARSGSAANVLSTHPPSRARINTVHSTSAKIRAAKAQGQTAPISW